MIVSIGLPDRNSVSFKLSEKLSELNAPVSFIGPFSNKSEHLELLNILIDKCIIFDPIFCNTEGELSDFTFERLKKSFDVNSDIEVICIDPVCHSNEIVLSNIKASVGTSNVKFILLDNKTNIEELSQSLVCNYSKK